MTDLVVGSVTIDPNIRSRDMIQIVDCAKAIMVDGVTFTPGMLRGLIDLAKSNATIRLFMLGENLFYEELLYGGDEK